MHKKCLYCCSDFFLFPSPGQAGAVQKSAKLADPGLRWGRDGRWLAPGSPVVIEQVIKILTVVGLPPHNACRAR